MVKLVTCNKCGRVYMGLPIEIIDKDIKKFNDYYDTLSLEKQKLYAGKATLEDYKICFTCGASYINFRDAEDGDCSSGCTISPILLNS